MHRLETPGFKVLLALAAGFRFEGSGDELLARFGAISGFKGIRYWSALDDSSETLISDASALDGLGMDSRRPDFGVNEMGKGKVLYFLQQDNRSSEPVIYGLQVLERSASRLVIAVENYTPVRMWLMTLFPPHELQFLHILDARDRGTWGFYSVVRVGLGSSDMSTGHDASYVSRAVAFYRHFSSIPTDQNPPVIWSSPETTTSRSQANRDVQP